MITENIDETVLVEAIGSAEAEIVCLDNKDSSTIGSCPNSPVC